MTRTTKVVALVPDLIDRSRLAALPEVELVTVGRAGDLAARAVEVQADVVVVDLSRPGVTEALAAIVTPTVGFGSHVDRDTLRAARAAGCDTVLARSAFFADPARWLAPPGGT